MSLKIDKSVYNDNSLTLLQKVLISERICSAEGGSHVYPDGEAQYSSIEHWERHTGRRFFQEFDNLYQASHGIY